MIGSSWSNVLALCQNGQLKSSLFRTSIVARAHLRGWRKWSNVNGKGLTLFMPTITVIITCHQHLFICRSALYCYRKLSHGCWWLWYSNWLSVPSKVLPVSIFTAAEEAVAAGMRRRKWSAVTGSGKGKSEGIVLSVTCALLIFLNSLFLIRKWAADPSSSSCS